MIYDLLHRPFPLPVPLLRYHYFPLRCDWPPGTSGFWCIGVTALMLVGRLERRVRSCRWAADGQKWSQSCCCQRRGTENLPLFSSSSSSVCDAVTGGRGNGSGRRMKRRRGEKTRRRQMTRGDKERRNEIMTQGNKCIRQEGQGGRRQDEQRS